MKIVVSDPKTRKAYQFSTESSVFLGKRIGDKVALDAVGLSGYEGEIRGGSDKQGFPMKPSLDTTARKKVLMGKGIGFRKAEKGQKKRKSVRGNTISEEIEQINIKVIKYGDKPLEELAPKKEKDEKK